MATSDFVELKDTLRGEKQWKYNEVSLVFIVTVSLIEEDYCLISLLWFTDSTAVQTHVALVVVGGRRGRGGRRLRGDDCLTRTLQADWEVPQHGGVSHWRELVMP